MTMMNAMAVTHPGSIETHPLEKVSLPIPDVAPGFIRIRVDVCGVCRTDLHIAEGDLPLKSGGVVPGHQVVGRVTAVGESANRFQRGDRVGVTWLFSSCGDCSYCHTHRENLCEHAEFTGYDHDGGYAEHMVIPESFGHPIPEELSSEQVAPLLCAGVIGYRSLRLSAIQSAQRLGLYGFGASAHVAIQVARHWGCEVYVFTRSVKHQRHALELGASWVGRAEDPPPHPLDSAILFAPSGKLVPEALRNLKRGGTLAINAVYMSPIPEMSYDSIYHERTIRSVANCTRQDATDLLKLASAIPIRTEVEVFPLEDATTALIKLKNSDIRGAAVLRVRAHSRRQF